MADGGFSLPVETVQQAQLLGGPERGEMTCCVRVPLYFVKAGAFDIFPFIYEKI